MSAPTPAPGDESPREGYYPDPSIPGYVRYWNGASWVPGTSRPAPGQDGTPTAGPAPQRQAPVDETGPMYLDEVDGPDSGGGTSAPEADVAPIRPRPASAWQADTSRQTGFGGERDDRVSWGGQDPRTTEPLTAPPAAPADGAPADPRQPGAPDPTRGALPGMRDGNEGVSDGTVAIRVDRPGGSGDSGRPPAEGTVTMRAVGPGGAARPPRPREEGPAPADGTMTIRAVPPGGTAQPSAPTPSPTPPRAQAQAQGQAQPPGQAQAQAQAQGRAQAQPPGQAQAQGRALVQGQAPALPTPLTPGPGGGSASWAQQAHQLAQPERTARPQPQPGARQQSPVPARHQGAGPERQQPVVPWKPPVEDPFQQLARSQSSARPAGLGKRLAARILDTVVLGALVGAVGFPLVTQAMDHIDRKIEVARMSGETVTVWLLDATTAGLFGGVLAAFLVLGFVIEALPTARWGRTLGKTLCGIEVRDIESHDAPGLGAALRRWLVYGVLGLLVVGVLNVLWCLFDRPWRQCWHDKAARTFVAGR
ncbi:RDD family protein [Streptomyces sp. NPDC102402]|uniref:RDD family protein n=1 Tax=Streptomyces sp. NPDC102402 TaxID=3366169 RepID=UPI0038293913